MVNTTFIKEQYNKIYPEGIENHYWNHARNRIINKFIIKHSLKKSNILEIGCGRGIVLRYLRTQGINCIGVELGDVEPVSSGDEYIYVKTDMRDLSKEIRDGIDTILLLDVIEHLKYPAEFIEEIKKEFKNLKNLLITVPARQELWTNYDTYNGHFRRYNLSDIKDLFHPEIKLIQASYFNHLLYPVFWFLAHCIKKRRTDIKAPFGFTIYLNRIISFILQTDYCFFPAHLPGTSIIALFSFAV